MTSTNEILRGFDFAEATIRMCGLDLGANAFGTALVGKPEPSRLGPSGDHRLSRENRK